MALVLLSRIPVATRFGSRPTIFLFFRGRKGSRLTQIHELGVVEKRKEESSRIQRYPNVLRGIQMHPKVPKAISNKTYSSSAPLAPSSPFSPNYPHFGKPVIHPPVRILCLHAEPSINYPRLSGHALSDSDPGYARSFM